MKRIAALLLALCCGGCFQSGKPLYVGIKPLQPFQPGPITGHDKDKAQIRYAMTRGADGIYRLTQARPARGEAREDMLAGFYAVSGLPSGMMVVETRACREGRCDANYQYGLARMQGGHLEWRIPDCSAALSKLAGISVKTDTCEFSDRASLEKALRVAAALPWQPDGYYEFR